VIQLLALVNRDGNELYRSNDWTALQGEHIVNLQTPITTVGDVVLGSTTVNNTVTAGVTAGAYSVSAAGQPAAQRVLSITNATTLELEMESTLTATATPIIYARDTYTIPSDFDRYISHTWWDRTNHWMLVGPQSPQFDQWQRSGIVTTGPRLRWRQIGVRPTVFRLWPPPTSASTPDALVFEYVNDGWVLHVDGTFGNRFTADTDIPLLNDQMFILGVKWRFWQIKGFSYGAMQQEYIDFVNREKARDGGMPDLAMGRRKQPYLITTDNVQDGNFPGS
jgi:acyl-CoA-binding protein